MDVEDGKNSMDESTGDLMKNLEIEAIGIVGRSHDDYEKEIINKIAAKMAERQRKETEEKAKKKLKNVRSEHRILTKR